VIINLWFNTLLTCNSLGCQREIEVGYNLFFYIFNKLYLSEFELKTSGFDTILDYYDLTSSPKSLSL
jgi:hypothetical protein